MMTDATAQKSARQVLGETLRFYREQRGYSPARVADIAKATRSDVDDWEAGRAVPPSAQWELLKKMVHRGLAQLGPVRQRALSEVDAERALVQRSMQRAKVQQPSPPTPAADKPLTSRPFADVLAKAPILKIVPDPKPEPPKPVPAPTPAPAPVAAAPIGTPPGVPSTLLGDTFDLTDAYLEIKKLPKGWGTTEAKEARYALAKELTMQNYDAETVVKKVREKFNVGISRVTLNGIHEELAKDYAKLLLRTGFSRFDDAVLAEVRKKVFGGVIGTEHIAKMRASLARSAAKTAAATTTAEPVAAAPPPVPVVEPVPDDAALIDYARMILSKSPSIKIDDLITQLTTRFKRSLRSQQLYDLRAEAKTAWAAKTTPTPEATVPPMKKDAPAVNTVDIETAAQLVLGAIPNLRTFTISVDDSGEVTVSHTTREVRVVEASGSIKLKR